MYECFFKRKQQTIDLFSSFVYHWLFDWLWFIDSLILLWLTIIGWLWFWFLIGIDSSIINIWPWLLRLTFFYWHPKLRAHLNQDDQSYRSPQKRIVSRTWREVIDNDTRVNENGWSHWWSAWPWSYRFYVYAPDGFPAGILRWRLLAVTSSELTEMLVLADSSRRFLSTSTTPSLIVFWISFCL